MFKRKIEEELKAWKESAKRKPLVIKGVRQCGKTSSVKHSSQNAFFAEKRSFGAIYHQ